MDLSERVVLVVISPVTYIYIINFFLLCRLWFDKLLKFWLEPHIPTSVDEVHMLYMFICVPVMYVCVHRLILQWTAVLVCLSSPN